MNWYIVIRYLHFTGILLVVASLFVELVVIQRIMTRQQIRQISKIDGIYGGGAISVVLAGLLMWFSVGKPED